MATLYTLTESNVRKTWFYLSLFFVLIIFIGWFLSYYFDSTLVLYIAIIYSVFSSFASYWWSDKIVLAISRAKPIEKRDNPELYRLVENLSITAGLSLPRIYLIEDEAPNAFATGRDPNHSVVVVTRGLLEKLERTELEGVIAHELAHIGNRDTLLATVITVLVGTVVLITDLVFRRGFRLRMKNDREGGSLLIAIIGVVFLLLASLFAQLIRFAISRKREFLADATGVLLTRHPEGLARALEKISASPDVLEVANNATAHLYIVNPFKGKDVRNWFVRLFSTHPPIEERISALRQLKI